MHSAVLTARDDNCSKTYLCEIYDLNKVSANPKKGDSGRDLDPQSKETLEPVENVEDHNNEQQIKTCQSSSKPCGPSLLEHSLQNGDSELVDNYCDTTTRGSFEKKGTVNAENTETRKVNTETRKVNTETRKVNTETRKVNLCDTANKQTSNLVENETEQPNCMIFEKRGQKVSVYYSREEANNLHGFDSENFTTDRKTAGQTETEARRLQISIRPTFKNLKNLQAAIASKPIQDFISETEKSNFLQFIQFAALEVIALFPCYLPDRHERKFWEIWRLSTFSALHCLVVSAIRLAQSGFYYDSELDDIQCFSCGLSKRHWTISEIPAIVHLDLSATCLHANFRDQRNVPFGKYANTEANGASDRPDNVCEEGGRDEEQVAVEGAQEGIETKQLLYNPSSTVQASQDVIFKTDTGKSPQNYIIEASSSTADKDSSSDVNPPSAHNSIRQEVDKQPLQTGKIQQSPSSPLTLPPPAGHTEVIEDQQKRSAAAAETAPSLSSLSRLTSLSNFSLPDDVRSEQVYFTTTDARTPSVSNAPAKKDESRCPTQIVHSSSPASLPGDRPESDARQAESGTVTYNQGLDLTKAVNPLCSMVSARRESFMGDSCSSLPSSRSLVLAGFYFVGPGDCVRCFYCGVTIWDWKPTDDPWERHVENRFSCGYVTAVKGDDFAFQTFVKIGNREKIKARYEAVQLSACDPVTGSGGTNNLSSESDPRHASTSASAASSTATSNTDSVGSNSESGLIPAGDAWSADGCSDKVPSSSSSQSPALHGEARSPSNTSRRSNFKEDCRSQTSPGATGAIVNGSRGEGATAVDWQADSEPALGSLHTTGTLGSLHTTGTLSSLHTTGTAVVVESRASELPTTVSLEQPSSRSTARTRNIIDSSFLQQLQEANRRLRQRSTCRLCGDRVVDTIFLPCGHLCTCESCAGSIAECCLCFAHIRGTARVYLE